MEDATCWICFVSEGAERSRWWCSPLRQRIALTLHLKLLPMWSGWEPVGLPLSPSSEWGTVETPRPGEKSRVKQGWVVYITSHWGDSRNTGQNQRTGQKSMHHPGRTGTGSRRPQTPAGILTHTQGPAWEEAFHLSCDPRPHIAQPSYNTHPRYLDVIIETDIGWEGGSLRSTILSKWEPEVYLKGLFHVQIGQM